MSVRRFKAGDPVPDDLFELSGCTAHFLCEAILFTDSEGLHHVVGREVPYLDVNVPKGTAGRFRAKEKVWFHQPGCLFLVK